MEAKKTLVICPTYNEAENIGSLLRDLMNLQPEVECLVVDDSSPDGTAALVQRFQRGEERVHLLLRPEKQGLAAAYLAGFRWALDRNFDHVVQMDADFSHKPSDLPRLIATLEKCDLVIGCRYTDGGGTSGWGVLRSFISRGGNTYAQALLRLPYADLTGGFNGWRREVLEKVDLDSVRSRGYAFQVEMKYRAHSAGFRIVELPIHFENRKLGRSKMSGWIIWEAAFRVLQLRRGAEA